MAPLRWPTRARSPAGLIRRRGTAFALLHSGGALGAMLVPPVVETLTRYFGWRWACAALSLAVFPLVCLRSALFIRDRPSVVPRRGNVVVIGDSVREGIRSRVLWTLMAVVAAASMAKTGAVAHLAALLTDRGMSPSHAAVAISVVGAASLVGRFVSGWMLDRLHVSRVSFALLVIASVGLFVLARPARSPAESPPSCCSGSVWGTGKCHALSDVAIVWCACVLDPVWLHVDGSRPRRRLRPDRDGEGFR